MPSPRWNDEKQCWERFTDMSRDGTFDEWECDASLGERPPPKNPEMSGAEYTEKVKRAALASADRDLQQAVMERGKQLFGYAQRRQMNQRRVGSKIEVIMHPVVQEVYELIKALRPKAEAWDKDPRPNPFIADIAMLVRALAGSGALDLGPPPVLTLSPLTEQESPMGPSPIGIKDEGPFTYPPKQGGS